MGWARFDDGYMDHPKIYEAGPWAELLDRRAIEHCAKYETDGLVTPTSLKRIARGIPKVNERVHKLLEVGRWTVNDTGGWVVHDFLKYNPSKAAKEDMRAKGRQRVAKHRGNAVTNAYQSRGGDTEEKRSAAHKLVERCKRCDELLGIDCECDSPLSAVPEVGA